MFWHIYQYRLKTAVRNKELMFWTFLFPIILGTFFVMAFSNLSANEQFKIIPVAVIDNQAYRDDLMFQQAIQSVSVLTDINNPAAADEKITDNTLFKLYELDEQTAGDALENGALAGYLLLETSSDTADISDIDDTADTADTAMSGNRVQFAGSDIQLMVSSTGIRQTILKVFIDEYIQTRSAVGNLLTLQPSIISDLESRLMNRVDLLRDKPASQADPNNVLIYFYSLMAMTCLYGGFWGMQEVSYIQANQSQLAARINLVPVHKMKIFSGSVLSVLTVHFLSLLLLIAYLSLVHRISFGQRIGLLFLACLVGSLTGVSIGAFIGSLTKAGEGLKTAILIGFSMFASFLSGLMMADMRYLAMRFFPPIRVLNPAHLISDAFYALYYYESLNRYWTSLAVQGLIICLMFMVTAIVIRRRRYASL